MNTTVCTFEEITFLTTWKKKRPEIVKEMSQSSAISGWSSGGSLPHPSQRKQGAVPEHISAQSKDKSRRGEGKKCVKLGLMKKRTKKEGEKYNVSFLVGSSIDFTSLEHVTR